MSRSDADRRVEKSRLLIVEGVDDQRFFDALLKHLTMPGVQTIPMNGKAKLRSLLGALTKDPGFPTVLAMGLVVDADQDSGAAFQSVAGTLAYVGLPTPVQPNQIASGVPNVSVLVIPPGSQGSLEDLCLASVQDDPAMPCLRSFFDCLRHLDSVPRRDAKAQVQVFLSTRPKSLRLGEAAEAGYWPWDSRAFDAPREFLTRLFTS
jgi:hypothetical protein